MGGKIRMRYANWGGLKGSSWARFSCLPRGSAARDPSVPAPGIQFGIFLLCIFSRRAPAWLYSTSPALGKLRHGDGAGGVGGRWLRLIISLLMRFMGLNAGAHPAPHLPKTHFDLSF